MEAPDAAEGVLGGGGRAESLALGREDEPHACVTIDPVFAAAVAADDEGLDSLPRLRLHLALRLAAAANSSPGDWDAYSTAAATFRQDRN